jgi:DNA-directed RNA polymerase subunit H (RpoH/RPB5)
MNDIVKINKTREVLRKIMDIRNYDTSIMPMHSDDEIRKMVSTSSELTDKKSKNNAQLCNFTIPHKTFPKWKTHIVYFNFPDEGGNSTNISRMKIETQIEDIYENNNIEDNIIIILPTGTSTARDTYINWIDSINMNSKNNHFSNPDNYSDLTKEIINKPNKEYSLRHLHNIQIFHINALSINILEHDFVPKHEKITNEKDIKNILDQYHVDIKSQFPVIQKHDAVAELLGFVSGDLAKITRHSVSSGYSLFYRICK